MPTADSPWFCLNCIKMYKAVDASRSNKLELGWCQSLRKRLRQNRMASGHVGKPVPVAELGHGSCRLIVLFLGSFINLVAHCGTCDTGSTVDEVMRLLTSSQSRTPDSMPSIWSILSKASALQRPIEKLASSICHILPKTALAMPLQYSTDT